MKNIRKIAEECMAFCDKANWKVCLDFVDSDTLTLNSDKKKLMLTEKETGTHISYFSSSVLHILPTPWELAINYFTQPFKYSHGHATVLSPVGSNYPPIGTGCVDSITIRQQEDIKNHNLSPSDKWSVSLATVGHTRCWLANLMVTILDQERKELLNHISNNYRLAKIPFELKINDTAALTEFARDCGWQDGNFTKIFILDLHVKETKSGCIATAWIAFTETLISLYLAELVGSIAEPQISPEARLKKLNNSINFHLRIAL
ncbi:hypothetical protein [Halomonas sp. KM-1]|uniref:hypothetical protein n=1 Tax=Halomonas sp. KM-1 TaxID=590061 RepID=UPI001146EF3B|nr:hypothetical protein [Halomonas sp. KM-1]